MTPTAEQAAIVGAVRDTSDNILVSALSGAAKTSTLELIAKAIPETQILALAFNKKIAVEMQERMPSNCKAMTLNSLGHRTWSEATGKRLRIEPSKTYEILSGLLENLSHEERKCAFENFSDILRTIDFGKACGYIPTGHYDRAKRLMNDDEFFAHLDEELSSLEYDLVRDATLVSLKQAFDGLCDYNDQILMPTVFHGAFPRYPLVLVDEAQDLSALNHATLRKLAKKRLIAVGDECQAIYGFRGAHADSMQELEREFQMKRMTLSVTFRCPQKIVEAARWRAPHMQYPDWAKEGTIDFLTTWDVDTLPEQCAVICRNNAPLFSLAIKLLKNGRFAEIAGNDVGRPLIKVLKKFGATSLPQSAVLTHIDEWAKDKIAKAKHRAKSGIEDRAECLRIFARQGETLGDAIAYAEHIFSTKAPVKLMTGHKSKGLEFDNVFFLNEELIGEEPQDRNLRYVIITRTKHSLSYINLEDFCDTASS